MPRKPQRSTSGRDAQGRSDARGQKLAGSIAVVAGATRGAGRGIAIRSNSCERSRPANCAGVTTTSELTVNRILFSSYRQRSTSATER